jgi:septation ring formation regulator EzrA
MAGPNGKRSLEEIFEEHLAVTKAGFDRVNQNIAETALALRTEMQKGFEQVDKRFEQVDKRFEQVDKRFEQVDKRFEQVDKRFERIEGRLDNMLLTMGGSRLDHETRITALEAEVAKLKTG